LRGAAVSSNTDDTNGVAGESNWHSEILEGDAQETELFGYGRAVGLKFSCA